MFGGGAVLAGMTTMNIGDRNSEFVRRYLALEKIRIVAEDLQGTHPRKVAFMPRTGQVMVKKLRLQQEAGVAEREQALATRRRRRARRAARAGASGVELFSRRAKPRIELFGAAATAAATRVPKARRSLPRNLASNCSAQQASATDLIHASAARRPRRRHDTTWQAVQKIKVLCVDDSALIRSLMTEIINWPAGHDRRARPRPTRWSRANSSSSTTRTC